MYFKTRKQGLTLVAGKLLLILLVCGQGCLRAAKQGGRKQNQRHASVPRGDVDRLDGFDLNRCGRFRSNATRLADTLNDSASSPATANTNWHQTGSYVRLEAIGTRDGRRQVAATCGGVIIHSNLVLTTASCVQLATSGLRVTAGLSLGEQLGASNHGQLRSNYREIQDQDIVTTRNPNEGVIVIVNQTKIVAPSAEPEPWPPRPGPKGDGRRPAGSQQRWSASVCAHPDYSRDRDNRPELNIALVKLRYALRYTEQVWPACVDTSWASAKTAAKLTAVAALTSELASDVDDVDNDANNNDAANRQSGGKQKSLLSLDVKSTNCAASKRNKRPPRGGLCLLHKQRPLCKAADGEPAYADKKVLGDKLKQQFVVALKSKPAPDDYATCPGAKSTRALYVDLAQVEGDIIWLYDKCYYYDSWH